MIERLVLFQLRNGPADAAAEELMRETRLRLLKIPQVLALRSGRNLDTSATWHFFLSVTLESNERLAQMLADERYVKFEREVLEPHVTNRVSFDFKTVPGGDPLLS